MAYIRVVTCIQHYKVIFIIQCVIIYRTHAAESVANESVIHPDKGDNFKYILIWKAKGVLKNMFGEGKKPFLDNNCPIKDCVISSDKQLFGGDLSKFDAILFPGWDPNWLNADEMPDKRYYHQKYVYVHRTSAAKAYVCHKEYDNFFNWTLSYKLDSDIIFPHINVKDATGKVVGPKKHMKWLSNMSSKIDKKLANELVKKTKAALWFDTKCESRSVSHKFVEYLQKALNKFGLQIDVYGKCSPLQCIKHECDEVVKKEYHFYLALEDSVAEDYVTENLLRPLKNNAVPIVYGGAQYNRFLPPGSYIDATTHSPDALAATMNSLIKNQTLYQQYFRWKTHYSFCLGQASSTVPLKGENVCQQTLCDLCAALHDDNMFKVRSAYTNFRKWWYPDIQDKCPKPRTRGSSSDTLYKGVREEIRYKYSKEQINKRKEEIKQNIAKLNAKNQKNDLKKTKNDIKKSTGKVKIKGKVMANVNETANEKQNESKTKDVSKRGNNELSTKIELNTNKKEKTALKQSKKKDEQNKKIEESRKKDKKQRTKAKTNIFLEAANKKPQAKKQKARKSKPSKKGKLRKNTNTRHSKRKYKNKKDMDEFDVDEDEMEKWMRQRKKTLKPKNIKDLRRQYRYKPYNPVYFDHPFFHHPSYEKDFDKKMERKMKLALMDKMSTLLSPLYGGGPIRFGGGGGGGAGLRTAGEVALEVSQIWVSVASNNYEVTKR